MQRFAEERAPDGFERVEDVFAPGEREEIAARYEAIAGFEPGQAGVRRGSAVDQRPDPGRE